MKSFLERIPDARLSAAREPFESEYFLKLQRLGIISIHQRIRQMLESAEVLLGETRKRFPLRIALGEGYSMEYINRDSNIDLKVFNGYDCEIWVTETPEVPWEKIYPERTVRIVDFKIGVSRTGVSHYQRSIGA
ncbi:MAG: hypothetical protein JWM20_624 [Patescibacteria group bacterium]|nr:hypothetical protein [Patescibacteria group bacterium]